MNSFIRWADRFCARHPGFGISGLMRCLVIGNAAVWLLSMMDRTGTVIYYLALYPKAVLQGQLWRLVTFVFIPASSGVLTLLFLYFYYFIGSVMEREWGRAKFSLYFFMGMLFTVVYSFAVYFLTGKSPDPYSVAEYIYLSMFFTFATYYPDVQVLLFFILPIKIKWLAWVDAVFFVYSVFTLPFPNSLLPVVAILNYLLFCGDILFSSFALPRIRQQTPQFQDLLRNLSAASDRLLQGQGTVLPDVKYSNMIAPADAGVQLFSGRTDVDLRTETFLVILAHPCSHCRYYLQKFIFPGCRIISINIHFTCHFCDHIKPGPVRIKARMTGSLTGLCTYRRPF